jgi:death-on-curing protein
MTIKFIPDEIVPIIHADLIHRYGGHSGFRDKHLLSSALAQPKMTSGRKFLHRSIFDKAAAYGFHLSRNHPFIDGNKRVAFVLMDIFLQENGWQLTATEEDAYTTMVALSAGKLTKSQVSTWLRTHSTHPTT